MFAGFPYLTAHFNAFSIDIRTLIRVVNILCSLCSFYVIFSSTQSSTITKKKAEVYIITVVL